MSREVQNLKSDLDNGAKNLERETERSRAIEKELQLRCGENERLAHRVNDQRNENLKLSKLVEELTSNCEMVINSRRAFLIINLEDLAEEPPLKPRLF